MKRTAAMLALAVPLVGCGDGEVQRGKFGNEVPLDVASATVKRADGHTVTALRGTSAPGATIMVDQKSTSAGPDGAWAIRAEYDQGRDTIAVIAQAEGLRTNSTNARQPKRPTVVIYGPDDRTVYTDYVTLSGRIEGTRGGSVRGAKVTIDGARAMVTGSHWTKQIVMNGSGSRYFDLKVSKAGYDGSTAEATVTRKLSKAERAARAAAREAKRLAKLAARRAADPTYGMSNEEILDACMNGQITDFKTCYKAGFKLGAEGSAEAMQELEDEGYDLP